MVEISLEQGELLVLLAELRCRRYEIIENMKEEKRRLSMIEKEIAKIDAWLNPQDEVIVC